MHAMILAAGRGERMRPLTDHRPKPLLEAGGKSLIVWHLEALAAAGFHHVVINHAHLGAMIEQALGDGSRWGLRLSYSPEDPALETAGGIVHALSLLGAGPFLVLNGDVFCKFPLARARTIALQMRAASLSGWCVMVPNPPHNPDGDFALRDGLLVAAAQGTPRVHRNSPGSHPGSDPGSDPGRHSSSDPGINRIGDEPGTADPGARLTFSGIGVYVPALFEGLTAGAPAKLAPLLREAAVAHRCAAERYDGQWTDVGTPERLAALDAQLRPAGPR